MPRPAAQPADRPAPPERPFLTVEEAAALLGISRTLPTHSPASTSPPRPPDCHASALSARPLVRLTLRNHRTAPITVSRTDATMLPLVQPGRHRRCTPRSSRRRRFARVARVIVWC